MILVRSSQVVSIKKKKKKKLTTFIIVGYVLGVKIWGFFLGTHKLF